MKKLQKLPKLGFLYFDYVLRFFNHSNFKGWPDKIETVIYHWGNDEERFIAEVKSKNIEILIGNIPATAYERFKEIAKKLPGVRFVPTIETQFSNKSKENVTLFCEKHKLPHPKTKIFYDREKGLNHLKRTSYPKIIKRSYGPSNFGGYFVHKVKSKTEALNLMAKKKYDPIYVQECIPIRKDLRVMLIGHKPICAFWRVAGKGSDLTNTSQGGYIEYKGVPIEALKVAIDASKASKAEYWACDIAENNGRYYILECATAFAAFSYIRDWIAQYLMWEFSEGAFNMPHIPMYHWEELGKIIPNVLKTLRHISFSQYSPSSDGDVILNDIEGYEMSKVLPSRPDDVPISTVEEYIKDGVEITNEKDIPNTILEESLHCEEIHDDSSGSDKHMTLKNLTLTDLMALPEITESLALDIVHMLAAGQIKHFSDLSTKLPVRKSLVQLWVKQLGLKS